MKTTKISLRKRWKNDDFISKFQLPLKYSIKSWNENKKLIHLDTKEINNIDLRGISDSELWFIPTFCETNNFNIDFSFGKGAVDFSHGTYKNINFEGFNFDRASGFRKSKVINCNFKKSKLIFDSIDTIFENCDFTETKFKGGFNEYGFKRCSFINCDFTTSQWKNLYFFACKFQNCIFSDFKVSNAIIRGFKVDKLTPNIHNIFSECEIDGLIELKTNYS